MLGVEDRAATGCADAPPDQARDSPAAARYYRPELDALRFGAFLGTFLFHRMDFVPTDPARDLWAWRIGTVGAFGVPVFFLLSAFLITELLLRELEETGKVHVGAFYVRRMLRIWPLYFAFFFGLAILNRFVPGTGADDPLAWLAFTTFAGNWYVTFKGWIAGPVDPLWSVSVEEQFYLVVPWVIALGGRRALVSVSLLLLAASYVTITLYAVHRSPGDHGEWTNSFVHFQFFSAGTILALLLRGRMPRLSAWVRLGGVFAAPALWLVALIACDVRSWDPQPTLGGALAGWALILAGTVLLFLSVLGIERTRIPAWLAHGGRVSYGLYVFHSLLFMLVFRYLLPAVHLEAGQPGADALGTAATLLATLAAAHLSFTWFEATILRLKARFTYVPAREDSCSG